MNRRKSGIMAVVFWVTAMFVSFSIIGCQPKTDEVDLGGGQVIHLALISPGTFSMGTPANELGRWSGDLPRHQVTLTRAFYMGVTEITIGQYQRIMGDDFLRRRSNSKSGAQTSPAHPVEQVSWFDAARFCNALSRLQRLTPCYTTRDGATEFADGAAVECSTTANGYRLPWEAEWEYACRAGTTSLFYWHSTADEEKIKEHCWFAANACSKSWTSPHALSCGPQTVATKLPNAWGLHDMSGNVWEWCNDWWEDPPVRLSARTDPTGPATGKARVGRGGSWAFKWPECRSGYRAWSDPCRTWDTLGFRIVRLATDNKHK